LDEEFPSLEIDTKGMEDRIMTAIDAKLTELKKAFTPEEVPESITESKKPSAPVEFDYRVGVSKWLRESLDRDNPAKPTNPSLSEENGVFKDWKNAVEIEYETNDSLIESKLSKKERLYKYKFKEGALQEGIGSVNPDCCIPEIWADDVERQQIYPGSVFWGSWFVRWERGIENRPGDKVWICTIGTAVATTIAAACAEPTTTGATFNCAEIDLTDYVCAYYLCKNDIESVVPDTIDELNAGLGSCLERQVDNYFFDVARTNGCTAGTITSSSAMSGSLIAEAMGSMWNGTYHPVVLIVHPVSMASLLQDTNFVYACRFGNRDVITGGRVVEWLGIQILMAFKGTLSVGSGSYDSLLLAKNALAGAIKHGFRIESEYVVRLQRRYVLATVKFGGTCLHPNGIWWIRSTED